MKEYIDKEEFLKRLNVLYTMLDNLEKMLYSSQLIELVDIPTANVVEREKIDKAIEEMNSIGLGVVMDCDEMRDYCVEILKRNIGESK